VTAVSDEIATDNAAYERVASLTMATSPGWAPRSALMIITKVSLPRRTFLRGVGASLALPCRYGLGADAAQ
jgi:hypothetical protein